MKGSLGLGASMAAATAHAIMIPSTMTLDPSSVADANSMMLAGIDPFNQLVKVECRGCLYAQPIETERGPGVMWTDGVQNALLANFSISNDMSRFEFNGVPLYPAQNPMAGFPFVAEQSGSGLTIPMIAQVPMEADLVGLRDHLESYSTAMLRTTAWGFSTKSQPTEDGRELLLTINVNIGAVEGQSVDVAPIVVKLIKDQDEKLMMLRAEIDESSSSAHGGAVAGGVKQTECHGHFAILCGWKDKLTHAFAHVSEKIHDGFVAGFNAVHQPTSKPGCKGKGMKHHQQQQQQPGPAFNNIESSKEAGGSFLPPAPPAVGEGWGEEARIHHRPGGHWSHKGEFTHHGDHAHGHGHGHHDQHHGPPGFAHPHPHHHGHHGHHGHGHHQASGFTRFTHMLGNFAMHVLAPMILGLAIGILLVFIGWSIAVLLSIIVAWKAGEQISWDIYMPRWRGGYRVVLPSDHDDDDEEGEDGDEEERVLPAYVDVEDVERGLMEKTGEHSLAASSSPPSYVEKEES